MSVGQIPYYDTAGAARAINEEKLNSAAAIASERAADLYGLRILARSIQSNPDNFTRFYRIERQMRPPSSSNKTVYAVSLPHHPGSLVRALASLASRGINLTKIESRPIKRDPWQYVFYLEFEGHASDRQVKEALNEMSNDSGMHRVLGSFALQGSTG